MLKLYLIAFLDIFSFAILLPIVPVHLLSIGGSRFHIGLLASIHALLQLSVGPLVGSWSDTKGRKPLLIQLGVFVLISNALLFVTSSLTVYFLSRILFGLSCHVQILVKALIADTVQKERQNEVFAKIGALIGLSFVIGPLVGSVLSSYGFEYIAAVLLLTSVLSLALYATLPNKKVKVGKETQRSKNELFQAFTNLKTIKWNAYWDVLTFKFLGETNNAAFFSAFGVLIMDEYGRSQQEMAYVLSFFSFMLIVANLSSNKLKASFYSDDTDGFKKNFHNFVIVTLLYVILYFFSSFWVMVVVIVPLAISRTLLDITWTEMLVSRATKDDSGKIMGVFESMIHMAGLLMPMITGYVGETYGYSVTFLLSIVPLAFGSVLSNYCLADNRKNKANKSIKND